MSFLIGAKIVAVRNLTKAEQRREGWDDTTTALVLDTGDVLYASQDDEGNGAGRLFGHNSKLKKSYSIGG